MMSRDSLLKRQTQLEADMEKAKANLHRLQGALLIVEEILAEPRPGTTEYEEAAQAASAEANA
jgi:hypothetical protein